MPPKALGFRAEQLAHFGGHSHRLFTAKKVGEWISACEQHGFPSCIVKTASETLAQPRTSSTTW